MFLENERVGHKQQAYFIEQINCRFIWTVYRGGHYGGRSLGGIEKDPRKVGREDVNKI
jgi:hypothetical protein